MGSKDQIKNKREDKITVYYDGLCHLCSREISHYKRQKGAEWITFTDITLPNFDALKEGLDPFKVHKELHVKTASGKIVKGVDSFITIWSVLPRYQWLKNLAQQKWMRPLLDGGYYLFARVRPLLPQKKSDCANSPYCEITLKGDASCEN